MQEIYRVNDAIIVDYDCRNFCTIPYPNHPRGCPNFNKHEDCPPKAKFVDDVFDFDKDLFFVIEEFNLKAHMTLMKERHPHWSVLQCKNLLYWQGGVRKKLKNKTKAFMTPDMIYTLLPEAMGVMVIDTAKALKVPIEKTPEIRVFKIALVGYPVSV